MIDPAAIEALAPDKASLSAAAKLRGPGGWPLRARSADGRLIWGECQGSGAAPYQVAVDLSDGGTRCSCPSRKLPCKHALALMLAAAEAPESFVLEDPPSWVTAWLGRRRASTARPLYGTGASGSPVAIDPEAASPDPETEAKRAAASKARAKARDAAIRGGLDELERWIADQLKSGVDGLIGDAPARCRTIAARLVDAKAPTLAARLDDLPGWLLGLRREVRPEATLLELGRLVLLARCWRADPARPELRREIAAAENREHVLEDPDALRVSGRWEALGTEIRARRDGLATQATWLLRCSGADAAPTIALLLDHMPGAAARTASGIPAGARFEGELAFMPGAHPLRAVIAERGPAEEAENAARDWPAAERDPLGAPPFWRRDRPLLLPEGRLVETHKRAVWWRAADGGLSLPIHGAAPEVAFGAELQTMAGVWDGAELRPLAALSRLGRLDLSGRADG